MVIWLRKILIHTIWLLSLSACNPESTNSIESQAAAIQSQELDLTGIPPEKIVITPADFSFAKGERIKFRAAGIFLKGLTQVLEKNLSWQSSDTQVLSIDSEGSAVASGEGEATITVTYLGVSSSSKVTVSAAEVMQVLILPQTINLELALRKGTLQASTFDLQATGLLTDGSLIDLGDEVEWVLDEDSGLSLDPLKAGRFNALMPGNWTIKAVYGVLQSQKVASIKGQKKVIVGIKTAVSPLVIRVGQSAPLSILAIYNDGTEAPLQEAWAFTKTSEILNRQGGNIVGLKSGSERLTIKSAAFQASIDVYVEEPSITSLSISPSSFILHLGESASFEVTANYSDGTSANVTSSMTASSSDPAKLSLINANSKVQGNAQGSANLIVSYRNKQAQALAAIDNPVLARLEIRPSSLTVASGVMADFQVYGIYTNGTETNLSAVASAQATSIARAEVPTGMPGKLLGKNPGTTSLSAAYVDPSTTRNITGNASVTVNPAELTALAFANSSITVALGRSADFSILGTYTDGSQVDVGALVQVTPDVSSAGLSYVGSITRTSNNKIRVQSAAQGMMQVIVSLDGKTAIGTLTVTEKQLDLVQINRIPASATANIIKKGDVVDFTATAIFSDQSTLDVTNTVGIYSVNWTPPNPAIASFTDNNGKKRVTGLSDGDASFNVVVHSTQGDASANNSLGVYIDCPSPGQVNGYQCWYLGLIAESCTSTCSAVGRGYHLATLNRVGSAAGNSDECKRVLNDLFRSSFNSFSDNAVANAGIGCSIYSQSGVKLGLRGSTFSTTEGASLANFKRVCSCE